MNSRVQPNAVDVGDLELSSLPGDWLTLLRAADQPRLQPAGPEGLMVWRVHLGVLPKWPHPIEQIRHRKCLYGKQSAALVDEGKPWAAEVEITRRMQGDGWDARWLLKFEKPPEHWRPYVAMDRRTETSLPDEVVGMLLDIGRSGAPDVVAWRRETGDLRIVGVESKRVGHHRDRISGKQAAWYRAAVTRQHIRHEDLVIAEWRNDIPRPRRQRDTADLEGSAVSQVGA